MSRRWMLVVVFIISVAMFTATTTAAQTHEHEHEHEHGDEGEDEWDQPPTQQPHANTQQQQQQQQQEDYGDESNLIMPRTAILWGAGLSIAASGRSSFFTIQPVDEFGNNITRPGLGKYFVVLVEPPSMRGVVMENGDGSLLVALVHEWGTVINSTVAVSLPPSVFGLDDYAPNGELTKDGKRKEAPRIHMASSPYSVRMVPYYEFSIEEDSEPLLPPGGGGGVASSSGSDEDEYGGGGGHRDGGVDEREEEERIERYGAAEYAQLKQVRAAYATLVVSDPFVMGALVLMHTLRKSGAMFPLVAMTTNAVSKHARDLMVHHGIVVKMVERIGNPKGEKLEEKSWDAVYTKCRAWELTEYDKVLFMDADQVVLKNIDHLFLRPTFSAVPDLAPPTVFNSGLMLLAPSQDVFQQMMNATAHMKSYDEGDQGFLNEFFWGRWNMLPFTYNYLKSKTGNPDAYYWFLHLQRWNIHVVHIVGVKPWVCSPFRDCGTGFRERHIPELWAMWWQEMEEVCSAGHIRCSDPIPYDDIIDGRILRQVEEIPFRSQDEDTPH